MTIQTQNNYRWSPRQPLNLDVTLHVSGQLPFSGRIRNISRGGLFVETDPARVADDAEVYIAFTLGTNSGIRHHRLPARCIRSNGSGVVLLFAVLEPEVIHGLRQLLYPAPALVCAAASSDTSPLRRPA